MAENELKDLELEHEKMKKIKTILPKDEADKKNAIIEIRVTIVSQFVADHSRCEK